jgi:2-hydroxycyclohexanecarboxyl-CoA dehydrogenase
MARPVAIVVGGSGGIGAAVCRRLGQSGFDVANMDVEPPAIEEEAPIDDHQSRYVQVDIRDVAAIDRGFDAVRSDLGPHRVLVNVAAVCPESPFLETTTAIWDDVLAVNARGVFFCCQAAVKSMLEVGDGRIINILSTASFQGFADTSVYCASKGAALLITRTLAVELGPLGIAVNGVAPGAVETPLLGRYGVEPSIVQHDRARTPMGRRGVPDDVAEAVLFLSTAARWMNGTVISVDGGFLATGMPTAQSLNAQAQT